MRLYCGLCKKRIWFWQDYIPVNSVQPLAGPTHTWCYDILALGFRICSDRPEGSKEIVWPPNVNKPEISIC